jgi:hypothetical protein
LAALKLDRCSWLSWRVVSQQNGALGFVPSVHEEHSTIGQTYSSMDIPLGVILYILVWFFHAMIGMKHFFSRGCVVNVILPLKKNNLTVDWKVLNKQYFNCNLKHIFNFDWLGVIFEWVDV